MERFFKLMENGTTVKTEIFAGLTTFTVVLGMRMPWQQALAIVFLCGLINIIVTRIFSFNDGRITFNRGQRIGIIPLFIFQ